MALNISITKKDNVDFNALNSLCNTLDKFYVTTFPIFENDFQNSEGIGLSINLKDNYDDFWIMFNPFLSKLFEWNYTIVELYNGEIIDQNSINKLKNML